jgi:arylsulfatase A-like enzyme
VSPLAAPLLAANGIDVKQGDIADWAASRNEPWFLWVAFNAPHRPFHHPPADLHSYSLPANVDDSPQFMKAMTEAMDTEIGRLLTSLPPGELANTIIIFVGDNGTHQSATESPFVTDHAKGTLYEGGVNVPLLIVGPDIVPGSECRRLVNVTDLFATIVELAGIQVPVDVDSTSLVPYFSNPDMSSLRDWVYSERFYPNGLVNHWVHIRTVRGPRYKLIEKQEHGELWSEELFDLIADPFEQVNLLDSAHASWEAQYNRLRKILDQLEPPPPPPGPELEGVRSNPSGSVGF